MAAPPVELEPSTTPRWVATLVGLVFASSVLAGLGLATYVSYDPDDDHKAESHEDGDTDDSSEGDDDH